MHGRWGETPLAAVTISLTVGIVISRLMRQYSFPLLAGAALLLISGAVLALRRNRLCLSPAMALCAICLCGLLLSLAQRDGYDESDVRSLLSRGVLPLGESLGFDGCVVEEGRKLGEEIAATIDLRAIRTGNSWSPCRGKGILRLAAAAPDEPSAQAVLRSGDRVRGWATWHVPRNYQNPGSSDHVAYLSRRGISLVGRTKSPRLLETVPQDCASHWSKAAVRVRKGLSDSLQILAHNGKEKEAAVLSSVVIGDYSNLDTRTREEFQNTGTYHVLVVSGLHVAWIAWVFIRLFLLLRVPTAVGRILSALGILFYASVVGFQASISRCLWMFILYLAGQSLFRRSSPSNILFASALILLSARPDWLMDAGFQLSFLSVMAICQMAVPLTTNRLLPVLGPVERAGEPERLFVQPGRWFRLGRVLRCRCELLAEACEDRWGQASARWFLTFSRGIAKVVFLLAETILVTASVQIWLEMVLAYHFNRLSWISPLANIVAVPVSSLVLIAGMALGIFAEVTFLTQPALTAAAFSASLLLRTNQWMSGIPAAWQRCPTPPAEWVLAALLTVSVWCFMGWRRIWIPGLLVGVSLAALSIGRTPLAALHGSPWKEASSTLRLTFLDVGEGDSIVIRLPDGRVWVVDAGGMRQAPGEVDNAGAFDVGEAVVSRYLWWEWIDRLERLVISHPDVDHAGGAQALLKNFPTGGLDYGETSADALLSRILSFAWWKQIPTRLVRAGKVESAAGVTVRTLNPPAGRAGRTTNENSVVLRLALGGFSALLTGDLEKAGEVELLGASTDLQSVLLKVAHHGSRAATLDPFLERVRPRWAVISVGRNNPFGHPSREVLLRLLRHGTRPLVTLDQGAVTFETDGRYYHIRSHVGGLLEAGILPERTSLDGAGKQTRVAVSGGLSPK